MRAYNFLCGAHIELVKITCVGAQAGWIFFYRCALNSGVIAGATTGVRVHIISCSNCEDFWKR